MRPTTRLQVEGSELREKINTRLEVTDMTAEQRAELDGWTQRAQHAEVELRAALVAEGDDAETHDVTGLAPEQRERVELRSTSEACPTTCWRPSLGAAWDGAEAELSAAAGVTGIPMELWDTPQALEVPAAWRNRDPCRHPGAGHGRREPGPDPPGGVRAQHRREARYRHAASGERNLCDRHRHPIGHAGRGDQGRRHRRNRWHHHGRDGRRRSG